MLRCPETGKMSVNDIEMSVSPSPDGPPGTPLKPGKRSGTWTRLKKRWNRKGVVEVDMDHHRFAMLNCIRDGIRDLITNYPDLGPKESLSPDEYTHVMKQNVTAANGQTFQFASYSSSVFATIRQAVGLSEPEYLKAIAPENLPYLEFVSNSKSGQDFYISNNKGYFLKTEKPYYIRVLQQLLGEYLNHFLQYPHSLIVKILGVYSIKMPGEKKLYFYVMQSIFYPDERVSTRYDIKGCLAGRYQQPPKPDSPYLTVLKDQNFKDETIELGPQRDWFLRQFDIDVAFLQELGVIDYSLLVGTQELHRDEKSHDLADLVLRVQKSLGRSESNKSSPEHQKVLPATTIAPSAHMMPSSGENDEKFQVQLQMGDRRPSLRSHRFSFLQPATADNISEAQATNRRLLPNTKNPLHIIDGPKIRYFVGIIDFLTLYECRQRTGRFLKTVKHCCGDHSTLPPAGYASRFKDFIHEHVA